MADDGQARDGPGPGPGPSSLAWKQRMEEQYRSIREHAETYPYVWASYIAVYGGLIVYTAYRWRKLRKTEDRVRGLQKRLDKLIEAEEKSNASGRSPS